MPIFEDSSGGVRNELSDDQLIALEARHDVYFYTLPPEQQDHDKLSERRAHSLVDALNVLATSDALDQLHKWHLVARMLTVRPDLIRSETNDESAQVLAALVDVVIGGDLVPENVTSELKLRLAEFAESAASAEFRLTPDRWRAFHRTVLQNVPNLLPTPHEAAQKPGCNDEPLNAAAGDDTSTVVSRFWSALPVSEFVEYVNPLNWPKLSPYWESMTPVVGSTTTDSTGGYTTTLDEVVRLPTGVVSAQLLVTYTSRPDHVMATYQATGSTTDDVVVDSGFVFATSQSVPPDKGVQTLVYSSKVIEFEDSTLNTLSDLACDNGWVDLMIAMALPKSRRVPLTPSALGSATQSRMSGIGPGAGSTPAPVSMAIDAFVKQAHRLIDKQAEVAGSIVNSAQRGELGRQHVEGLLALSDPWLETTASGVAAWRSVLHEIARAGRQR